MRKFQVGDHVRVVRKCASHEDGWANSWVPNMDRYVDNGKVYKVTEVGETGVYLGETGFYFPPHGLELATAEPKPPRKSKESLPKELARLRAIEKAAGEIMVHLADAIQDLSDPITADWGENTPIINNAIDRLRLDIYAALEEAGVKPAALELEDE